MPSQVDLLIDGNLAHMFGPEGAAIYFARLLKVDARSLRPTMSQEWPHAFFITSPTVQQNTTTSTPPTTLYYINRQPAHLLDYTIRQVGTIVPQGIWPPGNTSSADSPSRSAKSGATLNMPIFFVGVDRISLGLPLADAVAEGDRAPLQGASSPAPIGHGSTVYIRITVSLNIRVVQATSTYPILLKFWRIRARLFLVAGLQRVDNADNDQGPNPSAQYDIHREIRKATRKCSRQVYGSKFPPPSPSPPLTPFYLFIIFLPC